MVEPYSNSGHTAILTVTAAWDLTQQRVIPRLNAQQFLYVGTVMKRHQKRLIKTGQLNSYTANRKISVPEALQVNITEEYEWKALVQDSDLTMKQY
jgi:hypothetical protein